MKNYGRTSLSEFLGEQVVYRNLIPFDQNLPGLAEVAIQLGLPNGRIPRKTETDYAHVIVYLLRQAQKNRGMTTPIKNVLFIGDTRMLDGTAFSNICQAGDWSGLAFIGSENCKPPEVEVVPDGVNQSLYLTNRWSMLMDFSKYAIDTGIPSDESTAVILDIDKTALGARGRNGQLIDRIRVQAVQNTVATLLGSAFDAESFQTSYDLLNQPEFHPFTGDNQDYLAYICLILGSGLYHLKKIVADIQEKRLSTFTQFISEVDDQSNNLPDELAAIHTEIYRNVQAGDPTPFKPFRYNEYLVTIEHFGQMADNTSLEKLLEEEILITQEVCTLAKEWQTRGALLIGLSDKPDEAATPTPELASQGYLPIHLAATHAVGE